MGRPPRPHLHDALLEAARVEFARRGLERARVEDIARRAGASKGAFYLHFASKEQVFEEILQRFMGALEDQARRREEAEVDFRAAHAGRAAHEVRDLQIEFDCTVDLGLLEVFWRSRHLLTALDRAGARHHRAVSEFRRRMHAFVAGRMAEKQAAGILRRDLDPALLGDILVGTYEGFARRMADLKDKPDLERWLRSFTRLLYEGAFERLGQPDAARPRSPSRRSSSRRGQATRRRRTGT